VLLPKAEQTCARVVAANCATSNSRLSLAVAVCILRTACACNGQYSPSRRTHLATLQPPHAQLLPPTSTDSLTHPKARQSGLLQSQGTGKLLHRARPAALSCSGSCACCTACITRTTDGVVPAGCMLLLPCGSSPAFCITVAVANINCGSCCSNQLSRSSSRRQDSVALLPPFGHNKGTWAVCQSLPSGHLLMPTAAGLL
jgi:hypothetical protein